MFSFRPCFQQIVAYKTFELNHILCSLLEFISLPGISGFVRVSVFNLRTKLDDLLLQRSFSLTFIWDAKSYHSHC